MLEKRKLFSFSPYKLMSFFSYFLVFTMSFRHAERAVDSISLVSVTMFFFSIPSFNDRNWKFKKFRNIEPNEQ